MTTLGLDTNKVPGGEIAAGFRTGWLRYVRIGLSSAGGAALVLAAFSLLQRQPAEGFRLLDSWGPWPIVAIVALVLMVPFMSRIQETISSTFHVLVESNQATAAAQTKMAQSIGQLADQGMRQYGEVQLLAKQFQEVQTLARYSAQEFSTVYERMDRLDEALVGISTSVKALLERGSDER